MEGGSQDQESVGSGTKRTSVTSGSRTRNCKEFLHKFVDCESLNARLEDWFDSITEQSVHKNTVFDAPFELIDLQKFDYALEEVSFQQLMRMPSAVYASTSDSVEAIAYLAVEDFLHAAVKGLWEAFWSKNNPIPFSVACLYNKTLKFYQAEKAISKGKLKDLSATAILLNNPRHPHGKWDHILELALLRPDIKSFEGEESERMPSLFSLGEALFFALRVLLSRSLSGSNVCQDQNSVFILLFDSQYGAVVRVEGDVNNLEFNLNNVYECAAEWIKTHAKIEVSPIDRIWNKLGNANWRDIGTLQVLFATFHCIAQFAGMPSFSIEDLAIDHTSRLQTRRIERQLGDPQEYENGLFRLQKTSVSPEIVEVHDESFRIEPEKLVKLKLGSILWLEDSSWQKGYQLNSLMSNDGLPYYVAAPVEEPTNDLLLYVGSSPSQLEPAWEDMNLWYLVQRQTKILNIMKQKGMYSKYLPQLSASGRIIHPGECRKPSSSKNCDHPWCGTPILVTSPIGETVASMLSSGRFGVDDAIRCCHDCLSALSSAASIGIRHGDIHPENVICVSSDVRHPYFVLIGWGHAILEERDRPAMNLQFSSTFAFQEGKLCSASDAESLVYLLYFCLGGVFPEPDSVEGALQWREKSWSKRLIQQKLGDVSTILKAFADYVDSLCGTPYPLDYDIWLRRLKRVIQVDDHGKDIDTSGS